MAYSLAKFRCVVCNKDMTIVYDDEKNNALYTTCSIKCENDIGVSLLVVGTDDKKAKIQYNDTNNSFSNFNKKIKNGFTTVDVYILRNDYICHGDICWSKEMGIMKYNKYNKYPSDLYRVINGTNGDIFDNSIETINDLTQYKNIKELFIYL
jgi:hypothetical protein